MFYQILPEVKRSPIISRKHGTYQLHQDLSNSLRLKMLRNWEILEKSQNLIELLHSA